MQTSDISLDKLRQQIKEGIERARHSIEHAKAALLGLRSPPSPPVEQQDDDSSSTSAA
jgi:hypothetical protein